ncbi:cyclase family protein [Labrys wisconsinensis]|uniref:Kynurenine formamidase n=1 Tax=Labrys wisconsinensis TaxID=425677 RepID=A0ABU0J1N7_9HYPH|nr:cyclase family protein [Labrys wisconsinensis]MDQ0467550.1 kynurenine formamidase [Labrys wisconsinensis]
MADGTLWSLFDQALAGATFTDLTHPFQPGQPHFAAFPDEERSMVFDFAKGDAFQVHRYGFVGQWGTHVDPPVHFIKGGRTLDAIPVAEMLLPLVVLDITAKVAASADAVPELADVEAWEARHGRIPDRSFVALRTGWAARWPDPERFANRSADGISHTPGWSRAVLTLLFEQRGITAVGHEQIDTDPGIAVSAGDYGLEHYVLSIDRWQIELLANLDKVPEAGALIMATWPKAKDGSGFPARAVAIHS